MRIVIYGVGKVGSKIAETLSKEKHDVVIVDPDKKKIKELQQTLDILCLPRPINDTRVIREARLKDADVFIAVSDSDEENIVACLIAKSHNVNKTISRIKNTLYLDKEILDTYELGISHVIQPEKEVAKEIVRLIRNPWASEVDAFLKEQVLFIAVKVNKENIDYLNGKLDTLSEKEITIIVESEDDKNRISFFRENHEIKEGDNIFVLEKKSDVIQINKIFEDVYSKIQNVIILGGGTTGEELLEQLGKTKLNLKLIERDRKRCNELSEKLKRGLILCGDGTDLDLLMSENLDKTDCFIAITGDNENNVMSAMLAKQNGVKKVITKVSKAYEEDIVARIGLDATVNINKVTVNKILNFVRRKELLALSILDEDMEIMEFSVSQSSKITKKFLKEPNFVKGALIGAIYRNGEIIFPEKDFRIEENDRVLIFVNKKKASSVEKYFKSKK